MKICELRKYIEDGALDSVIEGELMLDAGETREKYLAALEKFAELFGAERDVHIYSVGGRTEVSGNHTDHNLGCVLAAAVNLELLCIAASRDDGVVRVHSEGFPEDVVERSAVDSPDETKFFTSAAIIAGMQKAFLNSGRKIGGFDAYTVSAVLKGSGLSSSAAFEVMIGNVLNYMYNDGTVDNKEIAQMAQYAENVYFGKPCGLMDQMACAVGGFISIDFEDKNDPKVDKIDFDLNRAGYAMCIVNTGGNHADLNDDYASVPREMKGVAALLGKTVLRECTADEVISAAGEIREKLGDRAFMRAMHFFSENERVEKISDALKAGDIDAFLSGIKDSGSSSFKFLQNVYTTKNVEEQGISLALCLTERFISGSRAAARVHGGGFAGTIQVFLPSEIAEEYKTYIESVFGSGSCYMLSLRGAGAVCLK